MFKPDEKKIERVNFEGQIANEERVEDAEANRNPPLATSSLLADRATLFELSAANHNIDLRKSSKASRNL